MWRPGPPLLLPHTPWSPGRSFSRDAQRPGRAPGTSLLGPGGQREEGPPEVLRYPRLRPPAPLPASVALATAAARSSCAQLVPGGGAGAPGRERPGGRGAGSRPRGGAGGRSAAPLAGGREGGDWLQAGFIQSAVSPSLRRVERRLHRKKLRPGSEVAESGGWRPSNSVGVGSRQSSTKTMGGRFQPRMDFRNQSSSPRKGRGEVSSTAEGNQGDSLPTSSRMKEQEMSSASLS